MDLKQLKTFVMVAETRSLSKASDRLKRGQPALSRQIRMLEDEMGVSLFVRHGRGMEPTEAGLALLARIKGLVYQLEQSVEAVASASSDIQGHVALGVVPTVIAVLATRIYRRVNRDYPKISLHIVEAFPGRLVELLQTGMLDAAILLGSGADLHLRTQSLVFEDFMLVGNAQSDLREDMPVPLKRLSELPLVLPGHSERHRNAIDAGAARHGVTLNVPYEVESFALTLSLVEEGLGYTIVPRSAIAQQLEIGLFRIAPFEKRALRRQLVLALPTGRPDTRAVLAINDIIAEEAAELITQGRWDAFPDEAVRRHLDRSAIT